MNNALKNKNSSQKRSKNKNKGRLKKNSIGGKNPLGVPARYPLVPGDSITTHIRMSFIANSPALPAASNDTGLIILGRGTNSTGYYFLSNGSAAFGSLSNAYQRFMVTNLRVRARAVGGTTNSVGAISYIPGNSTVQNPPLTISEVSQATHVAQYTWGAPGTFVVQPMLYYGDWKNCIDNDDSDSQAGLIQYYANGSTASSILAIFDIELDVAFAGLALN